MVIFHVFFLHRIYLVVLFGSFRVEKYVPHCYYGGNASRQRKVAHEQRDKVLFLSHFSPRMNGNAVVYAWLSL